MNASFIEENTTANSATPDPSWDESEKEASKGVRKPASLLKGKKAANQWCQLQVYLYLTVWVFFPLYQLGVWVWSTSVRSGSNATCGLAGWALKQLSHPLSSTVCQAFKLLTANSPSIRFQEPLIGSWVKKAPLDLSEGVCLCFRGTKSKLGWEARVGLLWSSHRRHERSHLPFCSLVYR